MKQFLAQTLVCSLFLFHCQIASSDDAVKERDDMKRLYHDLDMANQKAKKLHKVSLDLADLENAYDVCIGKAAALESCRTQTSSLQDKLHARVHDAQMLAEARKQTAILAQQAEAVRTPATNSVTIIDNSRDEFYPEHHHHYKRDRHKEALPGPTPPAVRLEFHQKF